MQQFQPDARALSPLPRAFLDALAEHEEVLVSSRDAFGSGTVPVWFIIGPPGVVYLFSHAFSVKVRRWRSDPWCRLRVPDTGITVEGRVSFVGPDEIEQIADAVVDRWSMQGAPTVEGLRRSLRDRVHVLIRVEAQSASGTTILA